MKSRAPRGKSALFAVAALLLGAAGGAYWLTLESPAPAPIAVQPRLHAVVGLGYLEPVSSVIKLGAPGNPDSSRIANLLVNDGDEVETAQVLAVLDTAEKLQAQLEQSQAQVALKRLLLEKQRHEVRSSIRSRRSALERARAELESARREFARQEVLKERGVATEATLEKRRRDLDTAEATVREMEAALERIETKSQLDVRPEGTLVDVAVTEQELAAAEADLKVARATLDQAIIRAPFKGRILGLKARVGERIGNDGLLELGDTSRMRAVIEVYQTDVSRIRPEQSVELKADALPTPLIGRVERVGAAVRRQTVVNNDPASATDARVVEVFVALDPAASLVVRSLSRLQVQAVFAP